MVNIITVNYHPKRYNYIIGKRILITKRASKQNNIKKTSTSRNKITVKKCMHDYAIITVLQIIVLHMYLIITFL